jgi:hypothetical protein
MALGSPILSEYIFPLMVCTVRLRKPRMYTKGNVSLFVKPRLVAGIPTNLSNFTIYYKTPEHPLPKKRKENSKHQKIMPPTPTPTPTTQRALQLP